MAFRFLMLSCNFVFVHQRFRRTFAMLLEEAVSVRLRCHTFSNPSTDMMICHLTLCSPRGPLPLTSKIIWRFCLIDRLKSVSGSREGKG